MKRFGWKKEDKIFYYTEFLGKGDNIDEDMITEADKNKYEKEIEKLNQSFKQFAELSTPVFEFAISTIGDKKERELMTGQFNKFLEALNNDKEVIK